MTNEWTKEIETLRAQLADAQRSHQCSDCHATLSWKWNNGNPAWFVTDAPDAPGPAVEEAIAAAVAAERARIRARVEALPRHAAMVAFNGDLPVVRLMPHPRAGTWLDSAATLSAIDATEGGAP